MAQCRSTTLHPRKLSAGRQAISLGVFTKECIGIHMRGLQGFRFGVRNLRFVVSCFSVKAEVRISGPGEDMWLAVLMQVVDNLGAVVPNLTAIAQRLCAIARHLCAIAPKFGTIARNFRPHGPQLRAIAPDLCAIAPNFGAIARRSGAV